jgi:LysR family hydrogen peroxide-inducible transcriptional activator
MQFAQIKYFLAACNTTNFTQAAKVCNVTQPALTRSIQLLEDELGDRLFLREHHLTQLTAFGKVMRTHFEQLSAEAEKLREAAQGYKLRQGMTLNLGVMQTIGPGNFRDLLKQFGASNKAVQLNLMEGAQEQLIEGLAEGSLHVAFMTQPAREDDRLQRIHLYSEQYLVAFPSGHRFQQMKSIRVSDFARERYVVWRRCEAIERVMEACRTQGFEPDCEIVSEREDWAQAMIAAGMGITVVPASTSPFHGVATRPLSDLHLERDVYLVSVAERHVEPPVKRFIRSIQTHTWNGTAAPAG